MYSLLLLSLLLIPNNVAFIPPLSVDFFSTVICNHWLGKERRENCATHKRKDLMHRNINCVIFDDHCIKWCWRAYAAIHADSMYIGGKLAVCALYSFKSPIHETFRVVCSERN